MPWYFAISKFGGVMASTRELSWAGGIVDGEGCLFIKYCPVETATNRATNSMFVGAIKVTMGCRKTVERIRDIVGEGKVYAHEPKKPRTNPHYDWLCQSRVAKRALDKLRPYLFTKAEEAKVLAKFFALPNSPMGGRGGNRPVPKSLQKKRFSLYLKLRKLKPRYRFGSHKSRHHDRHGTLPGRKPLPVLRRTKH
jgi:hypothetical protein